VEAVALLPIANKMVFLSSHEGDLYALDAYTGDIKWTKNLILDFDGKRPTWGFSGSPLLVNNKLILETGSSSGSLVCLHAKSGDLMFGKAGKVRLVMRLQCSTEKTWMKF
jgi:outer membrane protein assembly factor BamB